ncbi:MAG TPA: hypothetical protein VHH36_09185 [Candidatus Thermoplasmatota archaeon]|nr:hypothetical protein [Candidatus Thermoplasmatota archaeon]
MRSPARARVAWLLAAVAVAYGLATVAVFYASGTFTDNWLVVSLVVYGAILAGVLALALSERSPLAPARPDEEVLYRTRTGAVVRAPGPGGPRLAYREGETERPVERVEDDLDAAPVAPAADDRDVAAALRRHEAPGGTLP